MEPDILALALHDELRDLGEPARAIAEALERRPRILEQLPREALRLGDRHEARVRGLLRRAVLAGGLAERRRVALLVEDVVHDLEGEADALRVTVEALELGLRELLAAMRAEQDRSADERPGLEDMHVLALGEREVVAHRVEVDRLPARHAARAARRGEEPDHLELHLGIRGEPMLGEELEREALQRVAREERRGFVELDMAGGLAAAQHVVV